MSDKPPSKTIFIGNIPYGLSEEQIITLFSSAGQVLSFRLVTDSDTGRPKGYGFAEFADSDAAASAVRNLNGYTIMNRQLRVDFSHKDNSGGGGGGGGGGPGGPDAPPGIPNIMMGGGGGGPMGAGGGMSGQGGSGGAINISAVPPGVPLPPGVSCPDAISQTLARIPPAQLLDILSQFKGVVSTSPDSAAELLRQQPQLAYAIFQCLLTMGLVDASVLKQVIEGAAAAAPTPPPVNNVQAFQPPPSVTPSQQQPPQPPPPLPQQAQQPPQGGLPQNQLNVIKAILAMPPEQYNGLSANEKSQVDMLRAQYGSMMR